MGTAEVGPSSSKDCTEFTILVNLLQKVLKSTEVSPDVSSLCPGRTTDRVGSIHMSYGSTVTECTSAPMELQQGYGSLTRTPAKYRQFGFKNKGTKLSPLFQTRCWVQLAGPVSLTLSPEHMRSPAVGNLQLPSGFITFLMRKRFFPSPPNLQTQNPNCLKSYDFQY